jgi:glutamyl-tRNA reductase
VARRIVTPLLRQLHEKMNGVRERELAVTLRRRLPDLTPAQRAAIEKLSTALMNEFMRVPAVRLRAVAASRRESGVVDAARYLFALDEGLGDRLEKDGNARTDDARAA